MQDSELMHYMLLFVDSFECILKQTNDTEDVVLYFPIVKDFV